MYTLWQAHNNQESEINGNDGDITTLQNKTQKISYNSGTVKTEIEGVLKVNDYIQTWNTRGYNLVDNVTSVPTSRIYYDSGVMNIITDGTSINTNKQLKPPSIDTTGSIRTRSGGVSTERGSGILFRNEDLGSNTGQINTNQFNQFVFSALGDTNEYLFLTRKIHARGSTTGTEGYFYSNQQYIPTGAGDPTFLQALRFTSLQYTNPPGANLNMIWEIGKYVNNDSGLYFRLNESQSYHWLIDPDLPIGSLNRTITHLTISSEDLQLGDVVELTGNICRNIKQDFITYELDEDGNQILKPKTITRIIEEEVIKLDEEGNEYTTTEDHEITEFILDQDGNQIMEPIIIDRVTKIMFETNQVDPSFEDCVPVIKKCTTITRKFIGVVTQIFNEGDKIQTKDTLKFSGILGQKCYNFATHGDFLLKVPSSTGYNVGDIVMSNLSVLDPNTALTLNIQGAIVGKVSRIINSTTLSIFKE